MLDHAKITDDTGCFHRAAEELVVRRLIVEDAQGRKRIELAMQDDEPTVTFYDECGRVRASLAVDRMGDASWVTRQRPSDG